ncbi:hypothetical protein CAPTEDRAFT_209568 [Capitella teleta]|uniref:Uncharacterized protein n=1 Tax=Capitella teleta TaxID=283909 RepID=R7VLT7_CAPTE|nr:hypothetical protein CAPTEDRAFT_209568 [Capitella teleta]|eukprot:ELU18556.1 hypothetical protein CAPTEDRAFT_209568 [Capitella teleta]
MSKHRMSGFDPKWNDSLPWVREVDGGMICNICQFHQTRPSRSKVGEAVWVDKSCQSLFKYCLDSHDKSATHMQAMALEADRKSSHATGILSCMQQKYTVYNKLACIAAFRNIYFLMKNEIPHTTKYLKGGRSITNFIQVVPLNDGKAETITSAIIDFVLSLELPLEKMCAFRSDEWNQLPDTTNASLYTLWDKRTTHGDPQAKAIDVQACVKNKFRWEWLDTKVNLRVGKDSVTVKIGDSIAKMEKARAAYCTLCNKPVQYGSAGKGALAQHLEKPCHLDRWKARRDNEQLTVAADAAFWPTRQLLVKGALTIFHGPRIESAFSLMGSSLNSQTTRLDTHTVSALMTIKYAMGSTPAVEKMKKSKDDCHDKELTINIKMASKRRKAEQARKREEKERIMKRLELAKMSTKAEYIKKKKEDLLKERKKHLKQQRHAALTALARKRSNEKTSSEKRSNICQKTLKRT